MKFPLFKVAGILRASEKMVNAVTTVLSDLAVQHYGGTVLAPRLDEAELIISSFSSEGNEDAAGPLPDLSNIGKLLMNKVLQDAPRVDGKIQWRTLLASVSEQRLVLASADKESDYVSLRDTVGQITLLAGLKASKVPTIPTPTAEVIVPKEGLDALADMLKEMSKYPISNISEDEKAKNRAARAKLLSRLSDSLQSFIKISFKMNRMTRAQVLSASEYASKSQELRNRTQTALADAISKIDTIRSSFGIGAGKSGQKNYDKRLNVDEVCDNKELELAKSAAVESLTVVVGVPVKTNSAAYVPISASQKTSSNIPIFFNANIIGELIHKAITRHAVTDPLELKEIIAEGWRDVVSHELGHVIQALYSRTSGGASQMRGKMRYEALDDSGILKKDLNEVVKNRVRALTGKAKALQPTDKDYHAKIADLDKKRQELNDSLPLVREFEKLRASYERTSTNKDAFLPRMNQIAEHLVQIGLFPHGIDTEMLRIEHDSQDAEFFTELGNATEELNQHMITWAPDNIIGKIVKVFAGQATKTDLKDSIIALKQRWTDAAAVIAGATDSGKTKAALSGIAFFKNNNYFGSRQIADHINSSVAFIDKMHAKPDDSSTARAFNLEQEQLAIALDQYEKELSEVLEVDHHKFFEHLYSRYKKYGDEVALARWQRAVSELYAHAIAVRDAKFRVE